MAFVENSQRFQSSYHASLEFEGLDERLVKLMCFFIMHEQHMRTSYLFPKQMPPEVFTSNEKVKKDC